MKIKFVKPKIGIILWYLLVGIPVGVVTFGVIVIASVNGTKNPDGFIQLLLTVGMLYGFILGFFPALLTGIAVAVLRTNFVSKWSCLMAGLVGLLVTLFYLLVISLLGSAELFDSAFVATFLILAFVASTLCCYFFVLGRPSKKPN